MGSLFRQIGTVVGLSFATLPQRFWSSVTTILSIGLVVGVLLSFLSISAGFAKTLEGTGSEDVAIVIRSGAGQEINSSVNRDQQRLLERADGVREAADGTPLVSPELFVIVDARRKDLGGEANISLRGLQPIGTQLRDDFEIVEGRMFEPGTNEIIVGAGVVREFDGFELGRDVRFGTSEWRVVGVFAIPGTVFESELWADLGVVLNLFNRGTTVQTVRAKLTDPASIAAFEAYIDDDPRLALDVTTEKEFYASQGGAVQSLVFFGWGLAITLSFGALAGALNTMYSAVEARTKEIATLRAIGFTGFPAFVGAMFESLLLAVLGGAAGAGVAYLLFDGLSASSLGQSFTQVVFQFDVGAGLIVNGMLIALAIGLIGGLFPAIRAANTPLLRIGQD